MNPHRNPHRKRLLYIALTGAATLQAGVAAAVNLSAEGRGQVLLYPYYTTHSDGGGNVYGTLLSVVNGSGLAKAVRVRFLEGRNARAVLDFNLFLSPFDVWTAAVLPDDATGGARVGTADLSCTLPAFAPSPPAGTFLGFSNSNYSGAGDDGAGTGFDRAKEGYFEVIEMATYASNSATGIAVTHVNGVPPCHQFLPGTGNLTDAQAALDAQPPSGGLFGSLTLINVNSGTDYTADAVALANFNQGSADYQPAGAVLPDLTQAAPPVSAIQAPNGTLYESAWASGSVDPVSALLMHDSLMNEYVIDTATKSGTDWIVTFPTKGYYVSNGTGNAPKLFQRNFNGTAGSCDDYMPFIYDREERTLPPITISFGARPPTWPATAYGRQERAATAEVAPEEPPPTLPKIICWAANVMTFNNSFVLGSVNAANVPVPPGFQDGWLNLAFPTAIAGANASVHKLINIAATTISGGGHATTNGNTVTYVGLPAIGFAVVSYTNGTLQSGSPPVNVLSNYGGNFVHKTGTTIQ